jgi:hypothetical protein
MEKINTLCVFCGASTPTHTAHADAILNLADRMLQRGIGLVYGGGRVGLMGAVAERVMAGGGRVIGVIPHQLQRREVAFDELTELHVVDSMHERKAIMYERSDAFVIFPGGFGTLDEAMEILTWKQLGIHDKPIIFANIDGYYDHLKGFFERSIADGLLKREYVPLYHFSDSVEAIFAYLETYTPHHADIMRWA